MQIADAIRAIQSRYNTTTFLSRENVQDLLQADSETLNRLVDEGELSTIGGGLFKIEAIAAFAPYAIAEDIATVSAKNVHSSFADIGLQPRYNLTQHITDITDEEMCEMVRQKVGEGSVFYNAPRDCWQVAFSEGYVEGKRKRKILTAASEDEARRLFHEYNATSGNVLPYQNAGEIAKVHKIETTTMAQCYDQYLDSIAGQGSDRAFTGKLRLAKSIIADIGHYKMSDLTEDTLQKYLNSWTSKTYTKAGKTSLYSQQHINKVYVNLKCVIKYAKKHKLLTDNLLEDIPKPITKKYVEDTEKALSESEIKMILDALSGKPIFQTMCMIMSYTGIRPGEAAALRFSDFDFSNKTLSVKRALSRAEKADIQNKTVSKSTPFIKELKNERGGKKEYARRVLRVSDNVLGAVRKWRDHMNGDKKLLTKMKANGTEGFMFVKPRDGKLGLPDYYLNEYKKELERKGVDGGVYNLYRFRHTFCTRLFKIHKLDPKIVQFMMGDNSMDMVMRVYNSVNKEDIIAASANFSESMDVVLGI